MGPYGRVLLEGYHPPPPPPLRLPSTQRETDLDPNHGHVCARYTVTPRNLFFLVCFLLISYSAKIQRQFGTGSHPNVCLVEIAQWEIYECAYFFNLAET